MMPPDGLTQIRHHDANTSGRRRYPAFDSRVVVGLVDPIRRHFQQYANVRPLLMPGICLALGAGRASGDMDRHDHGARGPRRREYSSVSGRFRRRRRTNCVSPGVDFHAPQHRHILTYAFEYARSQPKKHLTSATKMQQPSPSPCRIGTDASEQDSESAIPDVRTNRAHRHAHRKLGGAASDWFDVVVGSNLLRRRGLGEPDPDTPFPSMEKLHGSAPDIAGQGVANPIAQIWSAP